MDDTTSIERASFWEHIGVLRTYILFGGFIFVAVAILSFFYFDNTIITLLLKPLHGQKLLFLSPLGPFLFQIKISFYAALLVAFPFWLGLFLRFIAPALSHSRKIALALFAIFSLLLGAGSLVLTYFYFIPVTLSVLQGFVVAGTESLLTAENYLSFCILELAVVFLVLQIPVITSALSYTRVLNPYILAQHHRFAILAIVTALAIVTPTTDAITLAVVSIPAIILWEIGLVISKILYTREVT